MKRCVCALLLVLLAGTIIPCCNAAGLIVVEDPRWWPGPRPPYPSPPHPKPPWPPQPIPPPRQYPFAPMEVESQQVNTRITNQIATTSMDQVFYNPNPVRLEGTFLFPVPKGAHLDRFSMELDGKQVEAELLTADKARHMYEDIVRRLRDPALLEYAGQDVFRARIFPIEPNSRKRVQLTYTQLLKADDGLVGYSLPLSAEKFSAKPLKNLSLKLTLETKSPLKSIYSPNHLVEIKRDTPNHATAGYEAKDIAPDVDFALYFATKTDEIGANLLTYKTSGEDGYFILLASPGVDVKHHQILPKDVAFVLDTSGSMAGSKLEQAKKALGFCIETLNDDDRFEIIRFSTEVEPLFDKLAQATAQNRSRAAAFIKNLKPLGATAIDDALRTVLELRPEEKSDNPEGNRPFVVIFLTDGRPTIGTTDEDEIIAGVTRRCAGKTRIFNFGIGTDVNTHLLDRISETTLAFSQYVLPEEDLELKVSSFFSKIRAPVLANPTLKFTGEVRVSSLYPSPLPDLFKGEQLVLVGRYSGHGDCAAVLEGRVDGARKQFAYDVIFPDESTELEFIPRLWAVRRVGFLLDEIRLHGDNPELRDEATDLARRFGIVTPYTAYLILEDESRHGIPLPARSLRNFDRDSPAYGDLKQSWQAFRSQTSGDQAVAGSRAGFAMKLADSANVGTLNSVLESSRTLSAPDAAPGGGLSATEDMKLKTMQYMQQGRFAGGKAFFWNETRWVDSAVQKHPGANPVRIQFDSKEYFDFITNHPQAVPWLALGQNVQFVLDNVIYEIYE